MLYRTRLGSLFSEGARLLWLALADRKLSQADAERLLGSPQGQLSKWLYGERRPGLKWAVLIQAQFDIPPETWRLAPSRKFVPPAAQVAAS